MSQVLSVLGLIVCGIGAAHGGVSVLLSEPWNAVGIIGVFMGCVAAPIGLLGEFLIWKRGRRT